LKERGLIDRKGRTANIGLAIWRLNRTAEAVLLWNIVARFNSSNFIESRKHSGC